MNPRCLDLGPDLTHSVREGSALRPLSVDLTVRDSMRAIFQVVDQFVVKDRLCGEYRGRCNLGAFLVSYVLCV